MVSKVKPIPEGMHSLTPYLTCAGAADAIAFYGRAFGAKLENRLDAPDGKVMHACLRIGDSALFLSDEAPQWNARGPKSLDGTPVTMHLYVENVDATMARAADAGARVTMPATDMFWGDRFGQLEDPFGHRWSVATHTRDLSPDEVKEAMAAQHLC